MRIVTANVRGFPAQRQSRVVSSLDRIAKVRPDLLGTQEMWEPRYRKALKQTLRTMGHSAPRSVAGTCVSWAGRLEADGWHKFTTGRWPLHGPVWGVCAFRQIVWVGFYRGGTGERLAFASVHFTPKAWRGNSRAKKAWRRGARNVDGFVKRLRSKGFQHIAFAVDANATKERVIAEFGTHIGGLPYTLVTSPAGYGIDHVMLVGEWDVHDSSPFGGTGWYSDHAALLVDAEPILRRKR